MRTIHPELRKQIVNWLFDNQNAFNRSNACREHFRAYIYDGDGNYLIGGEDVADYITAMDTELFR